ncbi:MAG: type II secretion system protein [Candidatus Saccharimonas sp.]
MHTQPHLKMRHAFTIVELIVVMVVIALIAALTLVSYNAIQARTRSSSAKTNAVMVSKKAEAWASVTGSVPTFTQLSTGKLAPADVGYTGPAEGRITDSSITLVDAASVNPTSEKQIAYRSCSVGAQTEWYDASSKTVKFIGIKGASSTSAC